MKYVNKNITFYFQGCKVNRDELLEILKERPDEFEMTVHYEAKIQVKEFFIKVPETPDEMTIVEWFEKLSPQERLERLVHYYQNYKALTNKLVYNSECFTLSELIEKCNELLDEQGDLPIFVNHPAGYGYTYATKVKVLRGTNSKNEELMSVLIE